MFSAYIQFVKIYEFESSMSYFFCLIKDYACTFVQYKNLTKNWIFYNMRVRQILLSHCVLNTIPLW